MATRHNLCQNPSCSISVAGWDGAVGGAAVPVRITGLPTGAGGFPVSTGAHYATSGTFLRTQLGAVLPNTQYTVSIYVRPNALPANGNIYVEWTNGAGAHTYSSVAYTAASGVVTRLACTGMSPADAVSAAIIVDGVGNFNVNSMDCTGVLIESGSAAGTYFDGDAPGPPTSSWDGAAGLSASTLTDSIPSDLTLAGSIPLQRSAAVVSIPITTGPMQWKILQGGDRWRISQGS